MTRLFTFIIFLVAAATSSANVVDLAPKRGRTVPAITWRDENGRVRNLNELAGYPLVLLPIYTRCPGACVQNVDRLKEALASSSADARQFRVLLFSFDPTETAQSLMKYRQRESIPLGWSIGCTSQSDIDALLDSIGVQVGRAGTEFTHPNIVVFLDPKLQVAKWIYGTDYAADDVDLALKIAVGQSDWIGQHAQLLYSLLLFAGSALCVALCYYLAQLRSARSAIDDTVFANRPPPIVKPW